MAGAKAADLIIKIIILGNNLGDIAATLKLSTDVTKAKMLTCEAKI